MVTPAALLGYLWWLGQISLVLMSSMAPASTTSWACSCPFRVGRRLFPDLLDSEITPGLKAPASAKYWVAPSPPATNTPATGLSSHATAPFRPAGRLIEVSMPSCVGEDVMPYCLRETVPFPCPRRLIDPTHGFPLFLPLNPNPRLPLLFPTSSSPAHDPRTEQSVSQQQAKLLLRDIFVQLFLLPQILLPSFLIDAQSSTTHLRKSLSSLSTSTDSSKAFGRDSPRRTSSTHSFSQLYSP